MVHRPASSVFSCFELMLMKLDVCGAFSLSLKRTKVNPTAKTTAAPNPTSISFPRSLKSVPVSSISVKTQIQASKKININIAATFRVSTQPSKETVNLDTGLFRKVPMSDEL